MLKTIVNVSDQLRAAKALSDSLSKLGCEHVYIGGFAWVLLGSNRPTKINVLVQPKDLDIQALPSKLCELSSQFVKTGPKLYYVKEVNDDLTGDDLGFASQDDVLIEISQAGSLGLPQEAGPAYQIDIDTIETHIKILHPGVLFLTKLRRWYFSRHSSCSKTIRKADIDYQDLIYLMNWLVDHEMTIEFEMYKGKLKNDFLIFIRAFFESCREDEELLDSLQEVMKEDDWDFAIEPWQ